MAQGRYFLGFPKYVAEKISLEEDNENWHGWVKHKDKLRLNLKDREVVIKIKGPIDEYMPVSFIHDTPIAPILLK